MKKFSMQGLDSDRSACMPAICYSGPINKQLLGEKKAGAKFQIDISKTEELVRVYTDGQTDGQTDGRTDKQTCVNRLISSR